MGFQQTYHVGGDVGIYRQYQGPEAAEEANQRTEYNQNITIVRNSRDGWMGRYNAQDQTPSESPGGSQAALLSTKVKKERWPHSPDFLAATLAFTLSLHSVWSLPISILQNGGLSFLLMYFVMLVLLGGPVLLLEIFLGQYSGLAPARLYRHLCPLLTGLGLTVAVQAGVKLLLELGVLTWAGQSLFLVFSSQSISDGFFYREVLNKEDSDLSALGGISGSLCLVLGIGSLLTFILVAAGTRSVGKVSMVLLPFMFMLLVSLTIRACIATGGIQGVTTLLSPNWSVMTQPTSWLEATTQVVFSMQLGAGAVSSYASYNKFNQNIVRDALIILISHLVWVLLGVLLILALLGVSSSNQTINLANLAEDPALVSITGKGVWLAAITVLESSLASLSYGWLWGGLFFVFITLVCLSSVLGYLEVITSSVLAIKPSLYKYRPLITFLVLVIFFLLDLFMATQGGIHVYHLLNTYVSSWPQLLVVLTTVLPAVLCHGTRNIMKDISDMSRVALHHFISSHLSTLYYTVIPVLTLGGLIWRLQQLSLDHLIDPLATFSVSLPAEWGMPLGWSLSFLPLSPILLGAIVHLAFGARGVQRSLHLKRSVRPTDRYYRNEHIEISSEATRNVSVV